MPEPILAEDHWMLQTDLMRHLELKAQQYGASSTPMCKQFQDWESSQKIEVRKEPVACLARKAAQDVRSIRDEYELRMCYQNALKCSLKSGADYIEGYVMSNVTGLVRSHAWNALGDHHFDVTDEFVLDKLFAKTKERTDQRAQIIRLSPLNAMQCMAANGYYGACRLFVFMRDVLGMKNREIRKAHKHAWWLE